MLKEDFFTQHPLTCASELIGCELRWDHCGGVIVETEAYAAVGDEACHTFLRRGAQKFVDTHPAGTAYIYLNYGIHWLVNVLVKGKMDGFVLIRALEPREGLALMRERRDLEDPRQLCSGPGKLTQAMKILPEVHGTSLCKDPCRAFYARPPGLPPPEIIGDVRIGISRAAELPWRFLARGSRYVSRGPTKKPDYPERTIRLVEINVMAKRRHLPAREPETAGRGQLLAARGGGGRRDSGGAGGSLRRASIEAAQGGCRQSDKGQEFDGLHIVSLSSPPISAGRREADFGWPPEFRNENR